MSDAVIEFEGVSHWYGDTVAVADVSFTVGPGVTGLLGHNGAGQVDGAQAVRRLRVASGGQGARVRDRPAA